MNPLAFASGAGKNALWTAHVGTTRLAWCGLEMNEEQQENLFKQWLAQYDGLVGRVARAYAGNETDCEDLVQEVLLQLWRSLPRFEGRASPSTWVYRVALNTALTWKRGQRQRWRFQPLGEMSDRAEADYSAGDEPERINDLYLALRQLPKADAALVVLYLDGLSYREMAEVLGISETNVGVKLNRARKALAQLINPRVYDSRT